MDTDGTQMKTGEKDFSLQPVTQQLIGAAFEVHNILGFGFLEQVYQRAMQVELQARGIKVELEPKIQVQFKGVIVGDYAADLLVADKIIVELKTDAVYQSAHEAQLLNELRGTGIHIGLSHQLWPRTRRIQTSGFLKSVFHLCPSVAKIF